MIWRYCFYIGILLLPLLTGCLTGANYHSARIVEADRPMTTFQLTRVNDAEIVNDDEPLYIGNCQLRTCEVPGKADFGTSITTVWSRDWEMPLISLGFDGKTSIIRDRLAFDFAIGGITLPPVWQTIQLRPSLIGSLDLSRHVELNASAGFLVWMKSAEPTCCLGLALGDRTGNLVVRPVVAWTGANDNQNGWVEFGIGLEVPLTAKEQNPSSEKPEPFILR